MDAQKDGDVGMMSRKELTNILALGFVVALYVGIGLEIKNGIDDYNKHHVCTWVNKP